MLPTLFNRRGGKAGSVHSGVRETAKGGIGNVERRAGRTGECAGAFLFLREGRTKGLWPKCFGL